MDFPFLVPRETLGGDLLVPVGGSLVWLGLAWLREGGRFLVFASLFVDMGYLGGGMPCSFFLSFFSSW